MSQLDAIEKNIRVLQLNIADSKKKFKGKIYWPAFYTEKKYGCCSDTTTNNTQDTIRTTLIYLMQPYDTSNSYIIFSTAVLSPE